MSLAKGRLKRVVHGSTDSATKPRSSVQQLSGKLASQFDEDKLMHLVLENDRQTVDNGRLMKEAFNQGISTLVPDMLYENLVKDYRLAERLYGETILRLITGYPTDYLQKNLRIPEFKAKLKGELLKRHKQLLEQNLLDREGNITETGTELASVMLYVEELERLIKGRLTGRLAKQKSPLGERGDPKQFQKGMPYRDINIRHSIFSRHIPGWDICVFFMGHGMSWFHITGPLISPRSPATGERSPWGTVESSTPHGFPSQPGNQP